MAIPIEVTDRYQFVRNGRRDAREYCRAGADNVSYSISRKQQHVSGRWIACQDIGEAVSIEVTERPTLEADKDILDKGRNSVAAEGVSEKALTKRDRANAQHTAGRCSLREHDVSLATRRDRCIPEARVRAEESRLVGAIICCPAGGGAGEPRRPTAGSRFGHYPGTAEGCESGVYRERTVESPVRKRQRMIWTAIRRYTIVAMTKTNKAIFQFIVEYDNASRGI